MSYNNNNNNYNNNDIKTYLYFDLASHCQDTKKRAK